MFLLYKSKGAVYVPNCTFNIEKHYFLKNRYLSRKEVKIGDCKYLIQKSVNNQILSFFLISGIEPVSQEEDKLFLQQYLKITSLNIINLFVEFFKLQNLKQSLINLEKLEEEYQIFDSCFKTLVTALPVNLNRLVTVNRNTYQISGDIRKSFLKNFLEQNNLEFKLTRSSGSIILNTRAQMDDNNKLIVKKGIEYSVEFLECETHINLSYTNLSRTVKSVIELKLQNPIDHKKHKLINIKTGNFLSHKVKNISEIKHPENVFKTFDTAQAFEEEGGNIRFSQEKFYFEQTDLKETIELINELQSTSSNKTSIVNFAALNQIQYDANIILNSKKFLFADSKLYYTPVEGLRNSGLFKMPINFKLKLIISTKIIDSEGIKKIIDNINERLSFLYKHNVLPITENDIILFNYENFDKRFLDEQFKTRYYNYIVHLINPVHSQHNTPEGEIFKSINKQIIKLLNKDHQQFTTFNKLDEYTVANVLLKLGIKNQAIPWKIDCIDSQDIQHIFIGIDLGHDHKTKHSNLTVTVIDNQGFLIDRYTKKHLQLNEVIPCEILQEAFSYLSRKFSNENQHLTIHRDGLLKEEMDLHAIMKNLNIEKYNLIEIVKSGVPLIGFYSDYQDNKTYLDGFQGYYVYTEKLSYLITNDQSLKTKTAPKPLKIRKIYGYKKITQLTEEVYWLTKPYSQNIFEPTKLPITLQKANNFSYSGNLIQFTSG